jgi:hypothetical protein
MYLTTKSGVAVNEYLYSTVGAAFDSATLAASTVTADEDGTKYLQKGTVLATITSGADSGKVGAYASGASDGRETDSNIVGILDTFAVVTEGDALVGYLYKGVVNEDKVYSDGTQGSVAAGVKTALQTSSIDILFR